MYIPTILHSYTSNSNVYLTPSSPALLYSLPYPLPSIFAFFGLFMDAFFATITISHSYISSTIGFTSPHTTSHPILYPYPYCPPAPHFRFFWTIYGHLLLLSPFPITMYLLTWSLKVLHCLDIPSLLPASACPPDFAFWVYLWAHFCMYL